MILSVSTRSDILAHYGDWFMHWLEQGYFYVKNPYNKNKVTKIDVSSENVDCLVFWTKNAIDFMKHLKRIDQLKYVYYFQYTITSYEKDIEKLKYPKTDIVDNFIQISKMVGKERVILRYDPILISKKYSVEYHLKAFKRLIEVLHPYTNKVVISFLDIYPKIENRLKTNGLRKPTFEEIDLIAQAFSKLANQYGLVLATCAEEVDLSKYDIIKNSCVDAELIEKITNTKLSKFIKANKRKDCLCLQHVDIGEYETCLSDCTYCYATSDKVKLNNYQSSNEFVTGQLKDEEVNIKKEEMNLFKKVEQLSFDFDNNNNTK